MAPYVGYLVTESNTHPLVSISILSIFLLGIKKHRFKMILGLFFNTPTPTQSSSFIFGRGVSPKGPTLSSYAPRMSKSS